MRKIKIQKKIYFKIKLKLVLIALTASLCILSVGCGQNTEKTQAQAPTDISDISAPETSIAETEIEEPTEFIFDVKEGNLFMENINVSFDKDGKYYNLADKSINDLIKNYWNEKKNIFYDSFPQKTSSAFNYWWYAHAIDVLADAYIRTGNETYREYTDKVLESILKKNKKITNDYYDDMEWMALALLRLYDKTKDEKYAEYTEILWEDIKQGWNDNIGGGIAWRKSQLDYKNTPANAPAAILAARLYRINGNAEDFEWAKKIYEFQKKNLVDNKTGQVWDGMNREGNGKIDKNWNFTYCHGVYLGAGVELYKITGDETYLEDAKKTAKYSLDKFFDEKKGSFTEDGEGDGGLFKGILTRYLTELYLICPDDTNMTEIKDKLEMCAETLNASGTLEDGRFSKNGYRISSSDKYDLSVQLSGVMLYEMMSKIEN